ncbi:MAG: hypothetical protein IRY91_08775 [Gemmatimonadaceae bacterium]|nr:hypothetical protein [Gemmatimonadaceae bacterium]
MSPPPSAHADRPRSEKEEEGEYDIERALADQPAASPAPRATPSPAPGTPPRTWSTKVRRPISAMRRGDDVLVICDDGSVWIKRPTGWTEEKPIPGSEVATEQAQGPGPEPGDAPRR